MYLTIITTASYILSSLLIIALYRTFAKGKLKTLWTEAKNQVKKSLNIKDQIQRAKDAGMQEFTIAGRTYLAKTQAGAIYTHKEFLRLEKRKKAAVLSLKEKHLKPSKNAIL